MTPTWAWVACVSTLSSSPSSKATASSAALARVLAVTQRRRGPRLCHQREGDELPVAREPGALDGRLRGAQGLLQPAEPLECVGEPDHHGITNCPWPRSRARPSMPRRRCRMASSKRSQKYSANPR